MPAEAASAFREVISSAVSRLDSGRSGEMPYCWIRGTIAA